MEGYRRTTSESRSRPTVTGFGKVDFRICKECRLTSRRSQPPLALSVPLSRFTSQVGGGSAFFVRRMSTTAFKTHEMSIYDLLELIRKRPGFYTIERSIFRLDSFIAGAELGFIKCGFVMRDWDDLRKFNEWVARRFGFNGTSGVANLIRDKSTSDADAFDRFFILL